MGPAAVVFVKGNEDPPLDTIMKKSDKLLSRSRTAVPLYYKVNSTICVQTWWKKH